MKPRHERSRSTTSTFVSQQGQDGGDANGSATDQEVMAQPENGVRPPLLRTDMEEPPRVSDGSATKERVRLLEREVASAKQREMKMLESLVQQTKELEQAKIALEEASLEVATLRQQQQQQGEGGAAAEPAVQAQQWSVMDLMFGGVDEEINGLRAKLRAAQQAEERSRKAADELAAALSAVTVEAKQVKAWLSGAQAEVEASNAEADRLRGLLQGAEAELWSATEQVGALTSNWKDAAAGWRAREKALVARARAAEEDAAAARRDNAGLRRALEQAVEEANAAAEALEAAGADNAGLQEAVAEKERALEALRRDNEGLRASEAAARARAEELQGQLAAKEREIPLVEKWRREDAQGKLVSSGMFLGSGRLVPGRKDRMFASLSNIAELKSAAAAAAAMDDYGYEFDHLDVGQPCDDATEHKIKRRSILRKVGDLFRRRRSPNLAPVLHDHY
ncbi:cingulin isoform X3 [Zea mays]|uniref:Uncharacterized protein n=1 Tax=Zea mays TaxID=4577 RepID=A0A804NSG8_MAIZE|nr:cingulin isoform X3 [Zea mays]|eukprot:XP_008678718.1 cingulin isoform X3 [Zea mays]